MSLWQETRRIEYNSTAGLNWWNLLLWGFFSLILNVKLEFELQCCLIAQRYKAVIGFDTTLQRLHIITMYMISEPLTVNLQFLARDLLQNRSEMKEKKNADNQYDDGNNEHTDIAAPKCCDGKVIKNKLFGNKTLPFVIK